MNIIVNEVEIRIGTRNWKGKMSYGEIVTMAILMQTLDQAQNKEKANVTYRKGKPDNQPGTLAPGETVDAENGMIFDVTVTEKTKNETCPRCEGTGEVNDNPHGTHNQHGIEEPCDHCGSTGIKVDSKMSNEKKLGD